MQTQIGFLMGTATYSVTMPDPAHRDPIARSVVDVGWSKNSIAHLPAEVFSPENSGLGFADRVSADGRDVDIYASTNADPGNELTIVCWRLPSGDLITHLPIDFSSSAASIALLLQSVEVSEDEELIPRLVILPPVGGGDPRLPEERDEVVFNALDESAPDIVLTLSGAMQGSTVARTADYSEVDVATELGVVVRCVGSSIVNYALVEETATSVAKSLTLISA